MTSAKFSGSRPHLPTDEHAPTRAPVTCWRCGGSDRLVLVEGGQRFEHRDESLCEEWRGERAYRGR